MQHLRLHPVKAAFALAGAMIMSLYASADTPFNGLILDNHLQPVKNVRVYTADRHRYAKSDKKGRFGLTDVAPFDTVTLEIGKRTIRIPIDGRKSMKIVLAEESRFTAEQDDELVNLGYGYVKRREHTGVSSGISGDQLRKTGRRDILSALSGLVAGLNISQGANGMEVNIRGQKSLTMSNAPIYFVDGVQVSSLDFVSINDVEHVEVLKDASIYGYQGANGAILVTTKAYRPTR